MEVYFSNMERTIVFTCSGQVLNFYGGQELRNVLDGDLAKEHRKKSENIEKKFRSREFIVTKWIGH